MNTHAEKGAENNTRANAHDVKQSQAGNGSGAPFTDNRPGIAAQKNLQRMLNRSAPGKQLKVSREPVNHAPQPVRQNKTTSAQGNFRTHPPVQKVKNKSGLPDPLKSGVESLSGLSMDDVKVHYNSGKPAQLQAQAYAQGADIHLAPGQEKHLPHEAWHVVQQKQGRVKPTVQMKGQVNVNNDAGLEKEADMMGVKSLKAGGSTPTVARQKAASTNVAQRKEEETADSAQQQELLDLATQLQNNKSKITGVAEGQVESAIETLKQAAHTAGKETVSEGLKAIREEVDRAGSAAPGKETAQMTGWRFAGAIIGGILGSIVPIVGTYFGAKLGWKLGKGRDDINLLIADGATRAQATAMLAIEPNVQTIHQQIQTEAAHSAMLIHQLYTDGASSAEITTLLGHEPNALTLHNLIQAEAAHSPARIIQLYTDGASSAEINTLLGHEPNALTLHNQIQAEAAHSPARIIQLYTDGASPAEITTLLGHEPNALTLHNQIQAEATHSPARIIQLYTDGASPADITTLLGHEPNALTLHNLIQAEAAHSPARIIQLYTDGASSAEINTLLGHEPNALTLHNQIQAEATHSPARIIQLYADGFTAVRITAMLVIEPRAQRIHNLIQPIPGAFTPGNLQFASMANGRYGSIYFPAGRIRLTHTGGPQIAVHGGGITRFTISNAHYQQYKTWKKAAHRTRVQKYNYVFALPSRAVAVAGAGERLIEFFGVNGAGGSHPSRGGPVAFPFALTQMQLNMIYNGANTGSNNRLRTAMRLDPLLATIPIN